MPRIILVVDDEPDVVKVLSLRMENEGYEALKAYNGEEAIRIATEKNPDLILMDVRMPVMNGFEATRILKKAEKTRLIPIIIVTASKNDIQSIVTGFESGADDYIITPYNKYELIARVKAALRLKSLQEELIKQQRLSAIAETVVTLSHEINNPLNVVMGGAEFLIRKKSTSQKDTTKILNDMKKASYRMARVMRKLSSLEKEVATRLLHGIRMIDIEKSKEKSLVKKGGSKRAKDNTGC